MSIFPIEIYELILDAIFPPSAIVLNCEALLIIKVLRTTCIQWNAIAINMLLPKLYIIEGGITPTTLNFTELLKNHQQLYMKTSITQLIDFSKLTKLEKLTSLYNPTMRYQDMPKLNSLCIISEPHSGGMLYLSGMENLTDLRMVGMFDFNSSFSQLIKLRSLHLENTSFTRLKLEFISNLYHLVDITFKNVLILNPMPFNEKIRTGTVKNIIINDCGMITGTAMQEMLKSFYNLETMTIIGTTPTPAAMEFFARYTIKVQWS